MSSWLSKQKKPELQALSEQAGLKGYALFVARPDTKTDATAVATGPAT